MLLKRSTNYCLAIAPVLLLLLSACSGLQTRQSQSTLAFAQNIELNQWQLRGKIGLKNSNNASSAYLNWRQCGDQFDIRINGPLGSGSAKLVGNSDSATLFENNREPISAPTPEQLLETQLGWYLPISQLGYWVRGIPSPDHFARGIELGFKQSGWALSFPRQTQTGHYLLPAKAIAQKGDVKVTLIFQQWQLQPDCRAFP